MPNESKGRLQLLRTALESLAKPPHEQRAILRGAVVTDELALDFDHAYALLPSLVAEGLEPSEPLQQELARVHELLDAAADDAMWVDEALDDHPSWVETRAHARSALTRLPSVPAN